MIYNKTKASKLSVVITSFKDVALVLGCIDSILVTEKAGVKIVVVDCLTAPLPKLIRQKYGDKVHLIHLNHDVGVAEQRNIGFRYCASKSDYTLFLDNDTKLQENAIETITQELKSFPQYSIFQPRIVSLQNMRETLEIGLSSNIFGIPKPIKDCSLAPFFVSGSGMLFRNESLKNIGGFDSVLQFGAEELDLTWRARLLGYDIKTIPDVVVRHRTQGTRGRLSSERLYLGLRNTVRMLLKNYGSPTNLFFATLLVARSGVEAVVFVITNKLTRGFESNVASLATDQNNFPDLVLAFVRAVSWNIARMRNTMIEHNRIQVKRKIKDKEIMSQMKKNDFIFISPAYHKSR